MEIAEGRENWGLTVPAKDLIKYLKSPRHEKEREAREEEEGRKKKMAF